MLFFLIKETADSSYIIGGYTDSQDGDILGNHGNRDSWIMKLSYNDDIEWIKNLDFLKKDSVNNIIPRQQTSDGGYILDISTGLKNHDFTVVKLSNDGNMEWQKVFDGLESDITSNIQQSSDNGYIISVNSYSNNVVGNENKDFWITKLSSKGITEWKKSFDDSSSDKVYHVEQVNDGGYIINGVSETRDTEDRSIYTNWIKKLSNKGSLEWQKVLGSSGLYNLYYTKKSDSGGFIVVSQMGSDIYNIDCKVIKITSKGSIEWQKELGGSGWNKIESVQQTTDGGYIIGGHKRPNDGDKLSHPRNNDYWIAKLSNKGNIEWEKTIGGSNWDEAQFIKQSNDGGYIVSGFTRSRDGNVTSNHGEKDVWIVKLSNQGNIEWEKSLGSSENDEALFIQESKDNGYIVIGYSKHFNSGREVTYKFWMVKLAEDGTEEWQKPLSNNGYGKIHRILQTDDGEYIFISHNKSDDIGYWGFRHKPGNGEEGNRNDINYRVIKLKID